MSRSKKTKARRKATKEFLQMSQVINALDVITWHKNFWQRVGVVSIFLNIVAGVTIWLKII